MKRCLPVMIGGVLSNVSCKLSHFDLSFEFFLKASEQNLALTWFEPVKQMGDGTNVIVLGE